jgi:hypothetical protein
MSDPGLEAQRSELKKLGEALVRPFFRRTFTVDPPKALELAGIDQSKIPPQILDAFANLTYDELSVLGRLEEEAGPFVESAKEASEGAICF